MNKTATRNGKPTRLPAAHRSEAACVGRMLCGEVDKVRRLLSIDDLVDSAHRLVFAAAVAVHGRGDPVTATTVFDELTRTGRADELGSNPKKLLDDLADDDPTGASLNYEAARVREVAARRLLIAHANVLLRDAQDGVEPAADLLARFRLNLDDLGTVGRTDAKPLPRVRYDDARPVLTNQWLIKGVLPAFGVAVAYGPPGSGKTFFALDAGLRVAAGGPWRGRRVKGGAVLYIAAEAGRGVLNRIEAFKRETGLSGLPFDTVPCSVDLLDPAADVDRVITAAKAQAAELGVPVVMIAVDTVSRSFGGGDENSAEHMTGFVRNLDRIRDALGGLVLGVHHSGKDLGRGARSHSSLHAAADAVIEITADETTRLHTAKVAKQRDGETGQSFAFKLRVVELGLDEDGDRVTSCVVVEADEPAADPRADLTTDQRSALNVLDQLVADRGREEPGTPHGRRVVTIDEWREEFYRRAKPDCKQDARQKAFRRASSALIAAKLAYCIDPFVWASDDPGQTGQTRTMSDLSGG